jgi:hypothetical protein
LHRVEIDFVELRRDNAAETQTEREEVLAVGGFVSSDVDGLESAGLVGELAARARLNLARDRLMMANCSAKVSATRTWVRRANLGSARK